MKFQEGEIDPSTEEYKLIAKQKKIVFADILTIEDVTFTFEWKKSMSSGLKVTINGMASVNDRTYAFKAVKKEKDDFFAIERYYGDMFGTILDYVNGFDHSIDESSIAGVHDGVNFENIKSLPWSSQIYATGHINANDGTFQLIFYTDGGVNLLTAFGGNGADLRMILTRKAKVTSISLVAIFTEGTNPGPVVDAILIDKNPDDAYVQRFREKQFGVIITQNEIDVKVYPPIQKKIEKLFKIAFPTEVADKKDLNLKSGVSLNVELDVRADINKCLEELRQGSNIKINDLQDTYPKITLSGHFKATGIQFSYPQTAKFPMKEFMICAAKSAKFIDIPHNVFDGDNAKKFYVFDYFQSLTTKTLTLRYKPVPMLSIDFLRLNVKTVDIGFTATKEDAEEEEKEEEKGEDKKPNTESNTDSNGRKNDKKGKKEQGKPSQRSPQKQLPEKEKDANKDSDNDQQKKSKNIKYELSVTAELIGQQDEKSRTCSCGASIPYEGFDCTIYIADLRIKDFIKQTFPSDIAEKMLSAKVLNSFYEIGVKDLSINFNMGNVKRIGATGTLILGKFENFYFEFIYYMNAGWAIGIAINEIPLEEIVNFFFKPFGIKISIPWLDKLNGAFIYSNIDIERVNQMENGDSNNKDSSQKQNQRRFIGAMSEKDFQNFASEQGSLNNAMNESYGYYDTNKFSSYNSMPYDNYRQFRKFARDRRYKRGIFNRWKNRKSKKKQDDENKDDKNKENGKDKEKQSDSEEEEEEDEPGKLFSLSILRDFEIKAGVKMKLEWLVPPERDCKENAICELLAKKLPSSKLTLQAEFKTKPLEFKVVASISTDIKLTDKLKFTGASLEISVGSNTYIEISATLRYVGKDTTLDFIGSLSVSASGLLKLSFGMDGYVHSVFGLKSLGIGNVNLGVSLDLKKMSFLIEFGASIRFGKLDKDTTKFDPNAAIQFDAQVGIDPANPANTWIYAEVSKLTLGVICRMFDNHDLDGTKLDEMGFNKGFKFSWNPGTEEKEIGVTGKTIPSGLYVNGGINFLWIEAQSELTINFAKVKFEIIIDMSPINWLGGLIKVTRSSDETKGPYCYIKYEKGGNLIMRIDGKIKIFFISVEVDITINEQIVDIKVGGPIIPGVLDGSVHAICTFGNSYSCTSFSVTISVSFNEFIKSVLGYIRGFLKKVAKFGEDIQKASRELKKGVDVLEKNTQKHLDNTKNAVNAWKKQLERRRDELIAERTAKKDYEICVDECDWVWIGFLDWKSDCWRIWGRSVGCPWWNSKKWKVKDIFCLAKCELEYLATAFMEWLNETINKLKIAVANVATGLLDVAKVLTKGIAELAKGCLTLIGTIGAIIKAAALATCEMFRFTIHVFEIKVEMKKSYDACFSVKLNLTVPFMKKNVILSHGDTELCLSQLLWSFVKMVFGIGGSSKEIKSTFDVNEKHSEYKGELDAKKEEQADMEEEEKKVEKEANSEMSKVDVEDATQRDMLPGEKTFQFLDHAKVKYNHTFTKEEREFLHTPHEMKFSYKVPNHMLHAFNEKSAWVVTENHLNNDTQNFAPLQNSSDERVQRSLDIDEESNPCDQMKRTLKSYSDITNGLMTSVNNMEYGKQQMKIERREHIDNLRDLHFHTHKLGTKYKNYTPKQKREIFFWYNNIKKGYEHHHRLNKRNIIQHDHHTIHTYRSNLNSIISRRKRASFVDHIDEMHEDAIKSYRKSAIGNPENEGENGFHEIRRYVKAVLTKDLPLSRLKRHLNHINGNIRKMNQHVARCE